VAQAQVALEKKQFARAIDLASRATAASPGDAEAWLTLGAAYDATGQRGAAKNAYRSCVARAASHEHVGECKALLGE
jgi:Flp pilus assembly protein TadD